MLTLLHSNALEMCYCLRYFVNFCRQYFLHLPLKSLQIRNSQTTNKFNFWVLYFKNSNCLIVGIEFIYIKGCIRLLKLLRSSNG